jgi:hypothetical protein
MTSVSSGVDVTGSNPQVANHAGSLALVSPLERLDVLRARSAIGQAGKLGVGYLHSAEGESQVVFTDLEGNRPVALPTRLSREQFDVLMRTPLPMGETRFMLHELATAYENRFPIMFEGGTAIGKTYSVNLFAKLLYGPRVTIPDFYCTGQTDASALLGKYVPAGISTEDQRRIHELLESDAGAALTAELKQESGGTFTAQELVARAALTLHIPFEKGSFEFQLGALPKALTATIAEDGALLATSNGPGTIIHIQEVGLAPHAVVSALLQLRGEAGGVARSMQIWDDGGRRIDAGQEFFLVCSTNPAGKGYQDRHTVSKELARGFHWVTLPERLSEESLRVAAGEIFSCARIASGEQTILDLRKHPEIGETLGRVMSAFHRFAEEQLKDGEPGRRQHVPVTLDTMNKVATLVQRVQLPTPDYSSIDLVRTLSAAVQGVYINSLQDKPGLFATTDIQAAGAADLSLGARMLRQLHLILEAPSEAQPDGTKISPRELLAQLTKQAFESYKKPTKVSDDVTDLTAAIAREAELVSIAEQVSTLEKAVSKGTEREREALREYLAQLRSGLSEADNQRIDQLLKREE